MARSVALLVGTKKGMWIYRSGQARSRWRAEGPHFAGMPIFHAAFDARDGTTVYAANNATWGGPQIQVSHDLGRTWAVTPNPAFPEGSDQTFERTWHIEPGHESEPGVVWAGVEPAALFRSEDNGQTWELVRGLQEHPTRSAWNPGGGGLCLHSIALDAADAKRLAIGISSGGVYETTDGGRSWTPRNSRIRGDYLPDASVEAGHCVHHLVSHPREPRTRFLQAHQGVYWWDDAQSRWDDRTGTLPSDFGFAAAIHPHDPATAYVIPLDPMVRQAGPPGIGVYRTRDRGATWTRQARGLPRGAALEVMREGMATDRLDPAGLYFGTTNGEVWASRDEGTSWEQVAAYLPPVLSISTATVA
jgi:hypothetical protein